MSSLVNGRVHFTAEKDKRSKPLIKFANDATDATDPGVINVNMKSGFNSEVYGKTLADLISQQTKFLEDFTTEWSKKMRSEIAKVKSEQTDTKCHYNHALLPGVMNGSRLLCEQVACVTGFANAIVGQFDVFWSTEARADPQSIRLLLTRDTTWNTQTMEAYLSGDDTVSSLEFLQGLVERASELDRCVDVYVGANRFATSKAVFEETTGSQFLRSLLDGCIENNMSQGVKRQREACLLGCENYRLHEMGTTFQTDSKEFYMHIDQVVFPGASGKSRDDWLRELLSSDGSAGDDVGFQWMFEPIFGGDSGMYDSFLKHQSRIRALFHKRERKFESQLRVDKLKAALINAWNLHSNYFQSQSPADGVARQLTWRMTLGIQDDYYLLLRLLAPYNVRREPCHRDLSGAVLPRHAVYQAESTRLIVCLLVLLHLGTPGHQFTLNSQDPLWRVMAETQALLQPTDDIPRMCLSSNVWHVLTRSVTNSAAITFDLASFNTCSSLIDYLLSASLAGGNGTSLESIIRQTQGSQPRQTQFPRADFILPVGKYLVGIPASSSTVYLSDPNPLNLGFLLNQSANINSGILQVYRTSTELSFKLLYPSSPDVVVRNDQIDVLQSLERLCKNGATQASGVTGYRTVPPHSTTPYGVMYGFCDLSAHFSVPIETWTLRYYAEKHLSKIQDVDPNFSLDGKDLVAYFQQDFTPKLLAYRAKVIAQAPRLYQALGLQTYLPNVGALEKGFYDTYYGTVVYFDTNPTYPEPEVRQYLVNKHFRQPVNSSAYEQFLRENGLGTRFRQTPNYYETMFGRFRQLLPNVAFSATVRARGKRLKVFTITSFILQPGRADYVYFVETADSWDRLRDALAGIFTKIVRCRQALQLKKVVLPVFGINDVAPDKMINYQRIWAEAFVTFTRQVNPNQIDVLSDDTALLANLSTFVSPALRQCFKLVQRNQVSHTVLAQTQAALDQTLLVDECTPDLLPGAVGGHDFYQLSASNLAISTSLVLNPFMTLSAVV